MRKESRSSTAIDANFLNMGPEAGTLTSVILMNNLGNMWEVHRRIRPCFDTVKDNPIRRFRRSELCLVQTFYSNNDKSAFEEILTKHYQCKVVR